MRLANFAPSSVSSRQKTARLLYLWRTVVLQAGESLKLSLIDLYL